jgi:flagellar biosynthesis/type III secretory pathway M-ring protein FliF/YscJ
VIIVGPDGQTLATPGVAEPGVDLDDASKVALSEEARAQAEEEARCKDDIEIAKLIARKDPRLFAEVLRNWMNAG